MNPISYFNRKVSGLGPSLASNIIAWRTQHGCFKNRAQLRSVKGIGLKTYEQCAGFLKILSEKLETGTSDDIK